MAMGSPVPPPQGLSAEDMVALATALLPSLLLQATHIPMDNGEVWSGGYPIPDGEPMVIEKKGMEWVAGWVRAARPDLTDACTHGVALALLSLSTPTWFQDGTERELRVREVGGTIVVSEEAVAAFYATLHSNRVLTELEISGGAHAFGTPAAAAHLGRFLNLNTTLLELTLEVDDADRRGSGGSCWGEAAWTALSEELTSNASIQQLVVVGSSSDPAGSSHVSAAFAAASQKLPALRILRLRAQAGRERATLGGMEGWARMLKHERCTLTELDLGLWLPAQGGLVAICEAILTNTTLKKLTIGCWRARGCVEAVVSIEEADAEALAAMLRTNRTLTTLHMGWSGVLWNDMVVHQGLSCNSSLEDLGTSLDPGGAHALMTLLQQQEPSPGGASSTATAASTCPQFQKLRLGTQEGQGFPTATALRDMLASNRTLLELGLECAPYSKKEWATTILPALANNQSLAMLNLGGCAGVDGDLVYDALLELLESNTCIQDIYLAFTPLQGEGKDAAVEEQLKAKKEQP